MKQTISIWLLIAIISISLSEKIYTMMKSDEACMIHLYAGMTKDDVIRLCGKPKRISTVIENREQVQRLHYGKLRVSIDEESKLMSYENE